MIYKKPSIWQTNNTEKQQQVTWESFSCAASALFFINSSVASASWILYTRNIFSFNVVGVTKKRLFSAKKMCSANQLKQKINKQKITEGKKKESGILKFFLATKNCLFANGRQKVFLTWYIKARDIWCGRAAAHNWHQKKTQLKKQTNKQK